MNSSQKIGGLRRANRIAAHYEHVSAVQALCMVLCCASGAALLILPSVIAGRFGTASWLLPFAGLAFSAATVLLIAAAYKKSGAPNVEALFDAAFGTHFGPLFCVLFRFYSIARAAVCVGVFACAVKGLMLPELPLKWILLIVCITVFPVMRARLTSLARLSEIAAVFLAAALLFMLVCIPAAHTEFLLPLFSPIARAAGDLLPLTLFCGCGAEVALYFYPLLEPARPRTLLFGAALGSGVKLYVLLLCIGVFGVSAISYYTWPVITMFKAGSVAGIDRPELLLMIFITILSLSPACIYAAFASRSMRNGEKQPVVACVVLILLMYLTASQIGDVSAMPVAMRVTGWLYAGFGLFLPLVLAVFARRRA